LRALDDRAALLQKMYDRAAGEGLTTLRETWARRRKEFEQEAAVIEEAVTRLDRLARRTPQ
jgi:hypothetical protein